MGEEIRVEVLAGKWETVGVDRHPGIVPQDILPTWSDWGAENLTFNIARDPELEHPDLAPFTPLEYAPDGGDNVTWRGYILDPVEQRGDDPRINVQAVGDQYYLDTPSYAACFSHEDLTAWVDVRSRPTAELGPGKGYNGNGGVDIGAGAIVLSWAKDEWLAVNGRVWRGAVLDLGPEARATHIRAVIESSNNDALCFANVAGADREQLTRIPTAEVEYGPGFNNTAGATGTLDATFDSPRRYLHVYACHDAPGQAAADVFFRVTRIQVRSAQATGAGGIRADQVARDALAHVPELDASTELIAATTLPIRHLAGEETPRRWIERANDYHGYRRKITVDRRLLFAPHPDRAILEVLTNQGGAHFEDTSTNSGRDAFNVAAVTGRSGSGEPLAVRRYSATAVGFNAQLPGGEQPRATTGANLAGWTFTKGEIQDAGDDLGAIWSGAQEGTDPISSSLWPDNIEIHHDRPANFRAGRLYYFDFDAITALQPTAPWGERLEVTITTLPSGRSYRIDLPTAYTARRQYATVWRQPSDDVDGYTIHITGRRYPLESAGQIGAFRLGELDATILDRRGRLIPRSLEVQAPTDPIAMAALGDGFLRLGARAPLKGSLLVTAPDAVTMIGTGRSVPPGELGLYTGELILLRDQIDPLTGDLGRIAIITAVSAPAGTAALTLDNTRTGFQALIARVAASRP